VIQPGEPGCIPLRARGVLVRPPPDHPEGYRLDALPIERAVDRRAPACGRPVLDLEPITDHLSGLHAAKYRCERLRSPGCDFSFILGVSSRRDLRSGVLRVRPERASCRAAFGGREARRSDLIRASTPAATARVNSLRLVQGGEVAGLVATELP
jgi:hypothetical protein